MMCAIVDVLSSAPSRAPDTFLKVLQLICVDVRVEALAEALFTCSGAHRLPLRGVGAHSGPASFQPRMAHLAG